MKKFLLLCLVLSCLQTAGFSKVKLIAFPGAEGFGKYSVGGRGGKVVAVTSLADYKSTDTPIVGTLRWALSQYVTTDSAYQTYILTSGADSLAKKAITRYAPLTIIFKVSGTIWLKEDLKIKRDSLTIAGQTAPGDGICIAGRSVLFNGATTSEQFYWGPRRKDIIVRYIRFRPGYPKNDDGTPLISTASTDVTYGVDMENYENAILDHCSIGWANEECLATYDTKYVTVQWCIVSEGLYCAYHHKGTRSYGGVWGGQYATYHHNLIAHESSRSVRFNGSKSHDTIAVIDYRNNVVYNWGNTDACYGAAIEIPNGRSELNMINNYYKKGPILASASSTPSATNKGHRLVFLYDAASPTYGRGYHYVNGNYINGYPAVSANNWYYGVQLQSYTDTATAYPLFRKTTPSTEVSEVLPTTLESAQTSYSEVIADVGATLPLRDAHDRRITNEVVDGTASGYGSIASYTNGSPYKNTTYYGKVLGIIDDPVVVGGWPKFTTGTVPADTDGDGIPDEWETANGLNPADSTDANKTDSQGYTYLEDYLNSITTFQNFVQAPFFLRGSLTTDHPTLKWQDVSDIEENYVIERSPAADSNYVAIDTIAANSTSYTDTTAVGGQTYAYRVMAITSALKSVYTDTVQITVPLSGLQMSKIAGLKVYPSPVKNKLNIQANQPISDVEIYDISGKLIAQTPVNAKQATINTKGYMSGFYTIVIKAEDGSKASTKILKD